MNTKNKKTISALLTMFVIVGMCGFANFATAQITFNMIVDGSTQWPAANYTGVGVAPDSGTNWVAIKVGYGTTVPIVTNNIQDSLGVVFPGVSVTFSNHTAGGAQYTWNDASTTGAVPPNPVNLMRTYTFFATYDVVVSGLAPGKYELWYAGHGNAANQQGTATINANNGGGTFKTANSALGRDLIVGGLGIAYTNFTGLIVSNNGVLRFTADYLNMFQVRPSQTEGPAFLVTGGSACGSVAVGVSGSVTTNTYLLYTNNVYTGQSVAGTGAAISFGVQSVPGEYEVYATNTATASSGQMWGTAHVYTGGIAINNQPTSVAVVTNLPALISVQATGDTLSFQWYKNGLVMTNGGDVSGALTANLLISPVQSADAANYSCLIQNPCGEYTNSTAAGLTLLAPRNLIWAGANPDNVWDHSELNFLLSGSPTAFSEGDKVTFDDSSANTTVAISNNITPTLISVTGTQGYTFSGPSKFTGVAQLIDSSSGTLTIDNANDYTGGTIVSNGATLSLGDGSSAANNGSLAGTVTVMSGGNLNYNFGGSASVVVNLKNSLAGSGTNNCMTAGGAIIATMPTAVSSGFNGTINVAGYTSLHAIDNNSGYALGNGSTINIQQDGGQAWLDRSSTAYNNTFNIQGNGYVATTPYTGAIRMFGSTINGPINLLANSRIGGTISGGTIQSVISGPYQLEVWGTTNSFVLNMGPTNGSAQAYAATLITAGSISAANSNAISSGPLTLDSGGDMRVNGNNITVSNLSSINSGNVLLIEGPRVRNMHATLAGTLTVGTDGTSTEFDGTFSDGAAASFGLTKVGAGTLTLTAVSTNTGAVTVTGGTIAMSGSGSFGKASQIIAGSGAFYDVTAAGGTLTLNSGQTLRGGGTVNGILVASAGSAVAPGLAMGTLTVSGNATVNGVYRPNLNRTNTPSNCSQFASSGGSITFSGATLSCTNVGPQLQVGDSFQLFAGATTGFSAAALQTNDVPNSANYTWANTVATDGKITVASVVSRVPIVVTAPTASAISYGQALSSSTLSGGSCTNSAGVAIAGVFAFTSPTNKPSNVGVTNVSVTFTPTDLVNYSSITLTLGVTVNVQTPVLKTAPTASQITNGQPLSLSILTGGAVTNAFSTNVVAGTFAFTTPSATPGVGTATQSVTFTPADLTRYNPITLNVSVTVVAAPSAVTGLQFIGSPAVSGTTLTISGTNTGGGTFYLLNTTNAAAVRNTWKPLWTNVSAGSSSFTTNLSGAVTPALGKQFYILSTTNNQ